MLKTGRRERRRGHGAQAAVRPIVVIVHPPAVRNISQLIDTQEQFLLEQFVPESAVERLDIAIFPGAARGDVQDLHARPLQPFLHHLRDRLRPIITADIPRTTPDREQIPNIAKGLAVGGRTVGPFHML